MAIGGLLRQKGINEYTKCFSHNKTQKVNVICAANLNTFGGMRSNYVHFSPPKLHTPCPLMVIFPLRSGQPGIPNDQILWHIFDKVAKKCLTLTTLSARILNIAAVFKCRHAHREDQAGRRLLNTNDCLWKMQLFSCGLGQPFLKIWCTVVKIVHTLHRKGL